MTYRNILVPVADRPEARPLLDTAFRLANDLNANVNGLHLIPEPDAGSPVRTDAAAAKKLFGEFAGRYGAKHVRTPQLIDKLSASWSEVGGTPEYVLPKLGPLADLIMVTRPKGAKSVIARQFMVESILSTGRPVIVLPPKRAIPNPRRIAVGWNRSVEASRALHAALPLLKQADQVTLIEGVNDVKGGPRAAAVAGALKWHGVKAEVFLARGADAIEFQIVDQLKAMGADLLIMGGYSRARIREIIFGGVTRYFVAQTKLPLFLLH